MQQSDAFPNRPITIVRTCRVEEEYFWALVFIVYKSPTKKTMIDQEFFAKYFTLEFINMTISNRFKAGKKEIRRTLDKVF